MDAYAPKQRDGNDEYRSHRIMPTTKHVARRKRRWQAKAMRRQGRKEAQKQAQD